MTTGANLFGLDVSWLDVPAFIATSQLLYALVAALWLLLALRLRRPGLLLAGVVAANAWAWFVTNFPLQSLYGVANSSDRLNNLAFCTVVAAGHSPLRTYQAGHIHFEPFWGALVAVLSGWSPDRVLVLYPFLPLVMAAGFALTLGIALRSDGPDDGWGRWERALVAGFATLLSSAPFEHLGTYRTPWPMTFLLKPNHALGLVLLPLFLLAFARMRTWRGRIAVGLLLHLIGWVFVIHMALVCVGLVVYLAWTWASRRAEAREALRDVAVVIGINAAIVSPYLYMLLTGYPMDPHPNATIPVVSPHLLEPFTRYLPLTLLGLWGALVTQRRGDRLSRLWSAQVLGAVLVWIGHVALSALQVSRERDESYYWVRFLLAGSAAIGAWDLASRYGTLVWRGFADPAKRAAALGLLALPYSLPYWWNPLLMDSYFPEALAPIPERVSQPTDWIRAHTDPRAVFAGDTDYARFVAALGARRVLSSRTLNQPADAARRRELERLLLDKDAGAKAAAADRWGVRYLVVTPRWLRLQPGLTVKALDSRRNLRRVFLYGDVDGEFVAIYEVAGGAA
jgi:hypothetical protein